MKPEESALMTEPNYEEAALSDAAAPAAALAGANLAADEAEVPLFSPTESKEFRAHWNALQTSFVDEPRRSLEQADTLVAGAMKRLAEVFADERTKLEGQWDREQSVTTEDLRLALRRYRSFFGRLLSV